MARKLRELTAFMAVLLLSLVLTACSHSQSSSTYDRVKQTNTITWGMRADTRLFSMMDVDSGKATGFEVDLARAITKQILGPKGKMKIEYISEKSRIMDLKIGNVDAVMATMTNTPDRRKIINFSDTNVKASANKLQIYDVFKGMTNIGIFAAKQKFAQTNVYNIIFFKRFKMLFPLDIISVRLIHNIRLRKAFNVIFYRNRRSFSSVRHQAVGNLFR